MTVSWEQTRAIRLERMHLAEPLGPRSLLKVVRDLGGVQAQVHSAAESACAARLKGYRSGRLDHALWNERSLIKTWAMRGTLHYLAAKDAPTWIAALATREHWRKPAWQRAFKVSLQDIERSVEVIADVLEDGPLTREELADRAHARLGNEAIYERLRSGWGELLKIVAIHGYLCFGPSEGRNVTFVRPDRWLASWRIEDRDVAIAEVCWRYLASHGPATREEFARWWGFSPPEAGRVLRSLGDEVHQVDREGDKAFVLARDTRAASAAVEDDEVRMLGMFDAYTLAGLPHEAIVPKRDKDAVYRKGAWVSQVVMRGGRVIGVWSHERKRDATDVSVIFFEGNKVPRAQITGALARFESLLGRIGALKVL